MKHLILGSEGQIGWHLKRYLRNINVDVSEIDIVRSSSEDLRICDNTLFKKKVEEADFVYFLAFDVGGSAYMQKYQASYDFISNNIKIMNNVFDLLKKLKKPFIFSSSQMSNMTHSPYGVLKLAGEKYTSALNGVTVKFWNVYGYERDPEKTHVITDFIKMAAGSNKITMRTTGEEERQFLYGDDAAECLYLLSTRYYDIDRDVPLHITSFEWKKVIDIADIISSHFKNCEVIPSDKTDFLQQGIKNEPDDYILRFWKARTPLSAGIAETIGLLQERIKYDSVSEK